MEKTFRLFESLCLTEKVRVRLEYNGVDEVMTTPQNNYGAYFALPRTSPPIQPYIGPPTNLENVPA